MEVARVRKPIPCDEWRRVVIFTVALVVVTLIPYLVGFQRAGDDWLFNGFTFGVDDGNAYLGKMRIGAVGEWRFSLFYTSETHDDAFGLYLPHIVAGHALRLIAAPETDGLTQGLTVTFQIWRVLASLILIPAIYRFIAEFLNAPKSRWLALMIATLGGGLGWLLVIVGQTELFDSLPLEFIVPEGFSFLCDLWPSAYCDVACGAFAGIGLPHHRTEEERLAFGAVGGACCGISSA